MTTLAEPLLTTAKLSLAFLWIFTGLTSLFFSAELGYEILKSTSITGIKADVLVYGGSLLDIGLGIWMLSSWKIKLCCIFQIVSIIIYSLLLTLIEPSFWLHPFGPLTKNIPIILLILIVATNEDP